MTRHDGGGGRRIAELRSVVDGVWEVSAAHGVEDACRALVKAASRAVPSAEIVFVSLAGTETGDLTIVSSTGLVSPEFRFGRGPYRNGLWGRAAEHMLPVRTGDYFADRSFEHDEMLDRACRADGVVSAICAPIVVDDKAIGAVYTNGRAVDMFDESDVTRLAEVTRAAAPVLGLVVAYGELEAAMSRTMASRNVLARSVAAHDTLLARILDGAGAAEVVDAIVESCDGAIGALGVDAADQAIATAPESAELDPLRDRWILSGIVELRRSKEAAVVERGEGAALFVPALAGERYVGAVVVVFGRPIDDAEAHAVQRLVSLYALVLARRIDSEDVPGAGLDRYHVRSLLSTRGRVSDDLRARVTRAGFDLDLSRVVVVAALARNTDPDEVAVLLHRALASDTVAILDRRIVVVTVGDPKERALVVLREIRRLTGAEPLVCSSAADDVPFGGLAEARHGADEALGLLLSLGRSRGAFDVDDFPAHLPLLRSVTVDSVVRFLDDTIGPVIEHDRHSSSELVRTMQVLVAENMNIAATARALELHPNTVIKRLHRVSDLLGPHWQAGSDSLAIRIALNLHALAHGPGLEEY
ncbi:helix-turn-helix domain-containing protein [Tsukamurella pseudospumae]|uniref:GAF domain-containing protein n=1 Tax=Tsukamurella pseudospumae TaxID=239498 RepID=A0A137ZZH6_9ACTN|nr:helix-turn-helix domain-containing protein [Tsukamurella pseudospumae]KXP03596.1 hypothetical protein AXK60_17470 [Tsukamurella pseudospumae]